MMPWRNINRQTNKAKKPKRNKRVKHHLTNDKIGR